MRYELNFDEDKIIDIEVIGDNGVLELKDCCKIMNEQQFSITELKEENEQLRKERDYWQGKFEEGIETFEISDSLEDLLEEQQVIIQSLKKENEALKRFIKDNFNEMMDSKMGIDV